MKKFKLLTSILALAYSSITSAATLTAPISISTAIEPICLVTAQSMSFPIIQLTPGTSNTATTNSAFTVECTKDTAYTVSMDGGLNLATDGNTRRLKHATSTEYLNYVLSQNGTNILVNQVFKSGVGVGLGNSLVPIQLTGSINTNQTVIAGSYNDTVTLTVEY